MSGLIESSTDQVKNMLPLQAWADNLLLTARKVGASLDRRRDGSQDSCTSTVLHNLQQELGMAQQAAPGGSPLPCYSSQRMACTLRQSWPA